jgi:hypothetical protein
MRWERKELKYRNTASVVPMYSIAMYIVVAEPDRAMTATKVTNLSAVGAYEMYLVYTV